MKKAETGIISGFVPASQVDQNTVPYVRLSRNPLELFVHADHLDAAAKSGQHSAD